MVKKSLKDCTEVCSINMNYIILYKPKLLVKQEVRFWWTLHSLHSRIVCVVKAAAEKFWEKVTKDDKQKKNFE
jgi:hypothetical protein